MGRTITLAILIVLSSFAFGVATQGGNITTANLPFDENITSLWYGAYGSIAGSFAEALSLNATPSNLSALALDTGSAYCPNGVNRLMLLFSNSTQNITSLSAGNLTSLDSFIGDSKHSATSTFASASSFATAFFGNISNVPTAYTQPAATRNFSVGYLQDQSGNFVFITAPVSNQTGFNGNQTDYQIILPTNNSKILYHITVDISCINATFQRPTGIATSNTTFNVTSTSQINFTLANQTAGNQTPDNQTTLKLVIPIDTIITTPNASTSPGVIIISVAPAEEKTAGLNTSSTRGAVLELEPSGTTFSQFINVSFNLSVVSSDSNISLATLQAKHAQGYLKIRKVNASGTFDFAATLEGEFLTAQVNSFSQFAVYDSTPAPSTPPPVSPSSSPSGGPSGGGSSGGTVASVQGSIVTVYEIPPLTSLPSQAPFTADITVLRFSPYREALQGETVIINPLIENPTNSPIMVDVGLADTSTAFYSPLTNVVINSGEKRSVPFEFRVPKDMPVGFYSFAVQISTQNTSISYPVIMRVVPTYRIGQPTITRRFSIDYENMQTLVTLIATNTANTSLAHLQFYESIPSSFVDKAGQGALQLENAGNSKGVVEGNTIKWELQDMQPSESRAISYKVPLMITDMSDYYSWNVVQTSSIQSGGANDIVAYDLQSPTIAPGRHGELSFSLFNAGSQRHEVTVQIFGPSQWSILPTLLTAKINPRDSSSHSVYFEVPELAESGIYGITLHISYANASYDKQTFVQVSTGAQASLPIAAQLTGWVGENFAPVMLSVTVVMLLSAIALRAYKKARRPHYDESRLEYLRNIERSLSGKK